MAGDTGGTEKMRKLSGKSNKETETSVVSVTCYQRRRRKEGSLC